VKERKTIVNFSKSQPSFSLSDFSVKFKCQTQFQHCFSICYSLVFQHLLTAVFQHQHMLQPGVSASAHSGVSASAYATAWCFSICSALCFSIYSAWCFSIYSAWCFSLCYSLVFQHKLQPGVSASKKLNRK
jgi:hypothetical protein